RHYDLAARSSLHGSGGNAGEGSAAPGEKPPRWSAERRVSRVMGRKAPRKRLACRVMCTPNGCRCTRTTLAAPPTLDSGERSKDANPGSRKRAAGRRKAVCMERALLYALVVLILRSARAEKVPQIRTRVRASRRMRTSDWVRPHASRRIAAHLGCGSACARVARKSGLPDLRL